MKLLLKRSQTLSSVPDALAFLRRPIFKLWAKIEFEGDEEEVSRRYAFPGNMLIEAVQPNLLRNSVVVGTVGIVLAWLLLSGLGLLGNFLAIVIGCGMGWYFYDRLRQTIYVRDLISGRYFDCRSVVALAKQEAFLGYALSVLRQVMETAKHWDGTEIRQIDALGVEEAKYVTLRSL